MTQHAIIIDFKRQTFAGTKTEESFIAKLNAPATEKDWDDVSEWVSELFDLLDGSEYDLMEYDNPSGGINWLHPAYEVTARAATLYDVPAMDAPGT